MFLSRKQFMNNGEGLVVELCFPQWTCMLHKFLANK